jgi:ABC-2 type transport system ATP-binding protein
MGQIVDVNDLSRSFGGKTALDGVSFSATAGQVYGLVGANGAGTTTLLKHLLGLLRATTGSVRVFGLDPVRDPVGVLRRIGYLSEERELPEWMRVDELMDYTRAFHPTWDASYARELLESLALDPSKKVKELSKGMRAQGRPDRGRRPSSGAADSGRALLRPRRDGAPRHPRRHRPHRGR